MIILSKTPGPIGSNAMHQERDDSQSSLPHMQDEITSEEETTNLSRSTEDPKIIRENTTSIATALLELGTLSDSSESPSCRHRGSIRKRTVSVTFNDMQYHSEPKNPRNETESLLSSPLHKRPRIDQISCSFPTEKPMLCASKLSIPTVMKEVVPSEIDNVTSFSSQEFRIPGELGSISQSIQAFRPLKAAPVLPSSLVPKFIPTTVTVPTEIATKVGLPMASTMITEHGGCYVMHSYTVLPRQAQTLQAVPFWNQL